MKSPATKDATAIPTIAPVLRMWVDVLLEGLESPASDGDEV